MKHKKHNRIVKDYEKQKMKHVEKLTNKLLKDDEKTQKLKSYNIKNNPFDLFDDEAT